MKEEATTIEHDPGDASLDGCLGDALANRGRSLVEAAATVLPCASSMTWA